jgi:hypothetical protein
MSTTCQCPAMTSLNAAAQAQLNGTSPWTIVSPGWAPEPDAGRGTLSIIWSCLVTIFACSWTVTHPDFPRKGEWHWSKAVLCARAVFAPEWSAVEASIEYIRVRQYAKKIKKLDKSQWTMSQLFLVFMGGVELEFEDCTETLGRDAEDVFDLRLSLDHFQRALQLDLLEIKSIPAEDVEKRAKTNYLVKALVCLQASWLVAQVIGRAVAKLPITTLEIVTVGYVVCALITYSCYWHKPQDAEVPILVNCKSLTRASFLKQIKSVHDTPFKHRWWARAFACMVAGTFGAVHCTAWNFCFPTSAEGEMWRVGSVLIVVIPSAITCFGPHFYSKSLRIPDWLPDWLQDLLPDCLPKWLVHSVMMLSKVLGKMLAVVLVLVLGLVLILGCVVFRPFLSIEPFIAFRSVPVGIFYTVNWSNWIPHV